MKPELLRIAITLPIAFPCFSEGAILLHMLKVKGKNRAVADSCTRGMKISNAGSLKRLIRDNEANCTTYAKISILCSPSLCEIIVKGNRKKISSIDWRLRRPPINATLAPTSR